MWGRGVMWGQCGVRGMIVNTDLKQDILLSTQHVIHNVRAKSIQ